jgi:hypothetical protein
VDALAAAVNMSYKVGHTSLIVSSYTSVTPQLSTVSVAGRWLAKHHAIHADLLLLIGLAWLQVQLGEGMSPLPDHGQLAQKYLGGGFGGYALYMFASQQQRDAFVQQLGGKGKDGATAVEPYLKAPGAPY